MGGKHPDIDTGIRILFEDNHLLVVAKPPGIPSQADESGDPDMLSLLKADLKRRYDKPGNVYLGLVHRLDRPVGGVMLFAKTSKAASRMSEAVRSRKFGKTYLAVVAGKPPKTADRLTHFLVKDHRTNTVSAYASPMPEGKEAILEYEMAGMNGRNSLVSIRLHTGRPHQIRVQMTAVGCPLVGDRKYGDGRDWAGIKDIALWSASISVHHPTTKEYMTFYCAPPHNKPWNLWPEELLQQASKR
ncbi:RluA family pseudouridine synthase [Paenibacillus tarimensis]